MYYYVLLLFLPIFTFLAYHFVRGFLKYDEKALLKEQNQIFKTEMIKVFEKIGPFKCPISTPLQKGNDIKEHIV